MKIIALYLPQFHEIKENNEWWGNGYTEWEAVKNAKQHSKSQVQPRVPLDENYYNLLDGGKTLEWQAKLAKSYGIYGFCFYHYWFSDSLRLLEKPAEILLKRTDIDMKFMFCWANESWTRTWYGLNQEVLADQTYGGPNQWVNHFNYLIQFFKDERYIKINNKPVFNILKTSSIPNIEEMIKTWNQLAIENGFDGIHIVSANTSTGHDDREYLFDNYYNFEPGYTLNCKLSFARRAHYKISVFVRSIFNRLLRTKKLERVVDSKSIYRSSLKKESKTFFGVFPMWDNTPRRSYKGIYYKNCSPSFFKKQLLRIKSLTEDEDFVYINAWNEWGEGCYLEPDSLYGYGFLSAIKEVVADDYSK